MEKNEYLNDENPYYVGDIRDYIEGKISLNELEEHGRTDDGMDIGTYIALTESEIPYSNDADFYRWYLGDGGVLPEEGTPEYEKMEEEHDKYCNNHKWVANCIVATLDALRTRLREDGYKFKGKSI